ncbi:HI_0552 family protein [Listeria aquatica]|uniref:HI_0552 family protein n=1 Tax=Listeria aquatica TaxID=1494960 RepID=UPI003F701412
MKLTASDFDALYLPEKQFRKLKEIYTEEEIDILKKERKRLWQEWRELVLAIYKELPVSSELAKPYIESWTNGWQMKGHFFATFRFINWEQNATCISLLWNAKYLKVGLEWQAYKAKSSLLDVSLHNHYLLPLLPEIKMVNHYSVWTSAKEEFTPFLLLSDFQAGVKKEILSELDNKNGLGVGVIFEKRDLMNPVETFLPLISELEFLYSKMKHAFEG